MAAPRFRPHDPQEFLKLLSWIRGARSLLEIGSRFGYPLVDFAHALAGKGRVVSVDLPDAEGWNDELSKHAIIHLRKNIQALKEEGYDAHLIEADSHLAETVEKVRALGPYDVVFIDGDHSYEGVLQDWTNYGEMGKKIIFHDIRKPEPPEDPGVEVWKLWSKIKSFSPPVEEFLAPGSKMGIGKIEHP